MIHGMLRVSGGGVGGILGGSRKPLEVKPAAAALFVEFRNSSLSSSGQTCRRGWHPVSSRSASVLGVCACARACVSVRSLCVEADTAVSQRPHCSSHYLRFQSVATLQSILSQHPPTTTITPTPMCLSSLAPVAPSSPSLANLQHGLEVLADTGFILRSGWPAPGKLLIPLSRTFTPICSAIRQHGGGWTPALCNQQGAGFPVGVSGVEAEVRRLSWLSKINIKRQQKSHSEELLHFKDVVF